MNYCLSVISNRTCQFHSLYMYGIIFLVVQSKATWLSLTQHFHVVRARSYYMFDRICARDLSTDLILSTIAR